MTKRGTNTLKGSARFLYASANWQSDNTPESSSANGLQTNSTRFIREYGGELGGPLIEDRLWLWAAGARQDISLSPTTFDQNEVPVPETATLAALERKAERPDLEPELADALLPEKRPEPVRHGGARGTAAGNPPERPGPVRLLQDRRLLRLRVGSLRVRLRRVPESLASSRFRSAGSSGTSSTTTTRTTRRSSTRASQQPQWQGNLHVSKFFQTGPAGHELKFGFNYRTQVIDSSSRPSRQPELRGAVSTELGRGEPDPRRRAELPDGVLDRHPRRHGVLRRLHAVGGTAFRSSARPQPRGTVVGQRDVRGPVPDRMREGLPGPARGRVRRRRRLADRIRRLGAADLGHICDRTEQSHSPARDVRPLRGSARLASGVHQRRARRERLRLWLERSEFRPRDSARTKSTGTLGQTGFYGSGSTRRVCPPLRTRSRPISRLPRPTR